MILGDNRLIFSTIRKSIYLPPAHHSSLQVFYAEAFRLTHPLAFLAEDKMQHGICNVPTQVGSFQSLLLRIFPRVKMHSKYPFCLSRKSGHLVLPSESRQISNFHSSHGNGCLFSSGRKPTVSLSITLIKCIKN
jgi:hypothetical protein